MSKLDEIVRKGLGESADKIIGKRNIQYKKSDIYKRIIDDKIQGIAAENYTLKRTINDVLKYDVEKNGRKGPIGAYEAFEQEELKIRGLTFQYLIEKGYSVKGVSDNDLRDLAKKQGRNPISRFFKAITGSLNVKKKEVTNEILKALSSLSEKDLIKDPINIGYKCLFGKETETGSILGKSIAATVIAGKEQVFNNEREYNGAMVRRKGYNMVGFLFFSLIGIVVSELLYGRKGFKDTSRKIERETNSRATKNRFFEKLTEAILVKKAVDILTNIEQQADQKNDNRISTNVGRVLTTYSERLKELEFDLDEMKHKIYNK